MCVPPPPPSNTRTGPNTQYNDDERLEVITNINVVVVDWVDAIAHKYDVDEHWQLHSNT